VHQQRILRIEARACIKSEGLWQWFIIKIAHFSRHYSEIVTGSVDQAYQSKFHLKTETKCSLQNVMLSFSLLATCGTPHLSFWLLGLARSLPHSPLVRPRFLPLLTDSYFSNHFHVRNLLIALMMEAARTSETLVNFYQTTRCYNPEDSHLRTHRGENLKFYMIFFN
jgi:hypothetical protein